MTIEVRQLLIKSQVNTAPAAHPLAETTEHEREQMKEEILAECKAWLAQQWLDARER